MGYALVFGACVGCKKTFGFNPNAVPSVTVNGAKEPICLACVETANPIRVKNGLEPIVPKPGAYEAVSEYEL